MIEDDGDIHVFVPTDDRLAVLDVEGFQAHVNWIVESLTTIERVSGRNASADLRKAYADSGEWAYVKMLAVAVVEQAARHALFYRGPNPILAAVTFDNLLSFAVTYRSLEARRSIGI